MNALVLMTTIAAAVALVAAPADAASKKRKESPATRASPSTPHPNSNVVYDSAGKVIGVDPDPFIRMMMRRDPTPWDSTD